MFYNREAAFVWNFSEIGKIRPEVALSQEIKTVPHTVWQKEGFPIFRTLRNVVIEMFKDRVEKGVFELNYNPYRNPWFLVKKKEKGKYCLIQAGR